MSNSNSVRIGKGSFDVKASLKLLGLRYDANTKFWVGVPRDGKLLAEICALHGIVIEPGDNPAEVMAGVPVNDQPQPSAEWINALIAQALAERSPMRAPGKKRG